MIFEAHFMARPETLHDFTYPVKLRIDGFQRPISMTPAEAVKLGKALVSAGARAHKALGNPLILYMPDGTRRLR